MGSRLNSYSRLPILHEFPPRPTRLRSGFSSKRQIRASSSSDGGRNEKEPATLATNTPPTTSPLNVEFRALDSCKLGISRYPDFDYNAKGGTGTATDCKENPAIDGDIWVSFNTENLYIPPLESSSTRFLLLPLPPFLKIRIVPEIFKGTINKLSGKVDLQFRAKFWFSIGRLYGAPPLLVETTLTSEESRGRLRSGRGERMDAQGRCRLVGVATVDPIDDVLMNSFLGLPTECIAELNASIFISESC